MSDPMVISAGGDVVSASGGIVIGADVVSIGDDVFGIGDGAIQPIGNIMHKHRQA
jgi:hypothetical protein